MSSLTLYPKTKQPMYTTALLPWQIRWKSTQSNFIWQHRTGSWHCLISGKAGPRDSSAIKNNDHNYKQAGADIFDRDHGWLSTWRNFAPQSNELTIWKHWDLMSYSKGTTSFERTSEIPNAIKLLKYHALFEYGMICRDWSNVALRHQAQNPRCQSYHLNLYCAWKLYCW